LTFRLSRPTMVAMAKISVPPETVADKPLRADARRNREKVLGAARAAFAEHGSDAQMDDVARRAEVGVGTVYRHFPTKEALFVALLEDTFARIAERARGTLERDDAWAALTALMWDAAESLAGDRAFAEAMQADLQLEACPGQVELSTITETLIDRAKAAGAMRPDAVLEDIPMVMCGVGSASFRKHPCSDAWRRHLTIVLDGLRARPDCTPLPS
jgi:AcrR family transcriptional regulator